jgi:hypothetical protein
MISDHATAAASSRWFGAAVGDRGVYKVLTVAVDERGCVAETAAAAWSKVPAHLLLVQSCGCEAMLAGGGC